MSIISKIKEALGITAMEKAQQEASKEAAAARKAAVERDERLFALIERLLTPQPAAQMPSTNREAELINQIAALQAEVKRLQEEKETTSKAAIEAFLASLSAKVAEGGGKVGRPKKDGTKVTLRIDAQSWAAVEFLRTINPHWKFTEFCNSAISDRLQALFEEDPRLEAAFNLWLTERLQLADQEG